MSDAVAPDRKEINRLLAFLIAHENLWPNMFGSPVDVAIAVMSKISAQPTSADAASAGAIPLLRRCMEREGEAGDSPWYLTLREFFDKYDAAMAINATFFDGREA